MGNGHSFIVGWLVRRTILLFPSGFLFFRPPVGKRRICIMIFFLFLGEEGKETKRMKEKKLNK